MCTAGNTMRGSWFTKYIKAGACWTWEAHFCSCFGSSFILLLRCCRNLDFTNWRKKGSFIQRETSLFVGYIVQLKNNIIVSFLGFYINGGTYQFRRSLISLDQKTHQPKRWKEYLCGQRVLFSWGTKLFKREVSSKNALSSIDLYSKLNDLSIFVHRTSPRSNSYPRQVVNQNQNRTR